MFSVKQLYDLQELDWEISARETSLEEVQHRLADDSELLSDTERLAQLESQIAEMRSASRPVESEVQQLDEKIKAVEGRLYGGAVTNARELAAQDEEREFLQSQRRAEEDRLLELMVEMEDVQSAIDATRARLSEVETQRAEERPGLLESEESLKTELEGLGESRSEIMPQIPSSVVSVYESLRGSRNGHAVAKVERGMCQGCRITLPTIELQRARTSQGTVQCNSCQRILYMA